MFAVDGGANPEVVELLLNYRKDDPENRVDVNAKDNEGRTALIYGVIENNCNLL